MTRRINQDALEHFFGLIRSNCGSSNHPDPVIFIQVYRLLSTYSLVKPPRGSNVTGGEILSNLLELKDLVGEENAKRREEVQAKIDVLLDGGIPEFEERQSVNYDHDYMERSIDVQALTVLGGYVSRKMRRIKPASSCDACFKAVCTDEQEEPEEREAFLLEKSEEGLLRPSAELFQLIFELEGAVLQVTSNTPVHANLFMEILDTVLNNKPRKDDEPQRATMIGCEEHKRALTAAVVTFFLTLRMHFICADANRAIAARKNKKREMAKLAKL